MEHFLSEEPAIKAVNQSVCPLKGSSGWSA